MHYFLFIYSLFLSGPSPIVHDVPIAIFHISEENNLVKIEMTFDLEDLTSSAHLQIADINVKNVQTYIRKNASFQFNNKETPIKISEIKIVGDHVNVKGRLGKRIENIQSIHILNTCLLNVRNHSNLIQIDLNNQSRDFRMHENRKRISVKY